MRFLSQFVDHNDASDIAQETFILAVRKIQQFEFKSTFRAWVFRIAYRQMLNFQKTKSNRKLQSIEETQIEARPLMTSDQTEQGKVVLELVEQLPELQRQVVWFRIHDQLSFKEIAAICNQSINTILSRMHKAKKNLALKMKSVGIETGVNL